MIKKYLVVRFDNDYTIPIQQTLYCIKNALNHEIKYYNRNGYRIGKDSFVQKFSKDRLESAVRHFAYIFSNLFGLTIHGLLSVDTEYTKEWFNNTIITDIQFGTKEEILEIYSDWDFKNFEELIEEFSDGGEWMEIEYNEEGIPVKVVGGINYINDDFLK